MPLGLFASVEIAVQAVSLSNVDLMQNGQGFYHLRITLALEDGDSFALPFAVVLPPRRTVQPSLAAFIDEVGCAFHTSTFPIRYSDDSHALEEIALFRVEVPTASLVAKTATAREGPAVLIHVELMFGRYDVLHAPADDGAEPTVAQVRARFAPVCSSTLRYMRPLHGSSEYFPFSGDCAHFVHAPLCVHSVLFNVRPRQIQPARSLAAAGARGIAPPRQRGTETVAGSGQRPIAAKGGARLRTPLSVFGAHLLAPPSVQPRPQQPLPTQKRQRARSAQQPQLPAASALDEAIDAALSAPPGGAAGQGGSETGGAAEAGGERGVSSGIAGSSGGGCELSAAARAELLQLCALYARARERLANKLCRMELLTDLSISMDVAAAHNRGGCDDEGEGRGSPLAEAGLAAAAAGGGGGGGGSPASQGGAVGWLGRLLGANGAGDGGSPLGGGQRRSSAGGGALGDLTASPAASSPRAGGERGGGGGGGWAGARNSPPPPQLPFSMAASAPMALPTRLLRIPAARYEAQAQPGGPLHGLSAVSVSAGDTIGSGLARVARSGDEEAEEAEGARASEAGDQGGHPGRAAGWSLAALLGQGAHGAQAQNGGGNGGSRAAGGRGRGGGIGGEFGDEGGVALMVARRMLALQPLRTRYVLVEMPTAAAAVPAPALPAAEAAAGLGAAGGGGGAPANGVGGRAGAAAGGRRREGGRAAAQGREGAASSDEEEEEEQEGASGSARSLRRRSPLRHESPTARSAAAGVPCNPAAGAAATAAEPAAGAAPRTPARAMARAAPVPPRVCSPEALASAAANGRASSASPQAATAAAAAATGSGSEGGASAGVVRIDAQGALSELHGLAAQLFALWHAWLQLLRARPREVSFALRRRWEKRQRERWGESVFSTSRAPASEGGRGKEIGPLPGPLQLAQRLRQSGHFSQLAPLRLAEAVPCGPGCASAAAAAAAAMRAQPILLEVRCPPLPAALPLGACNAQPAAPRPAQLPPAAQKEALAVAAAAAQAQRARPSRRLSPPKYARPGCERVQLIVMVHGWGGSAADLRSLRSHMRTLLPDSGSAVQRRFLLARSNEQPTTATTFAQMGENLAGEVLAFLKAERIGLSELERCSFVCFSLGGVVARAALAEPSLAPLLPRLHTFLTLGTPHLGVRFGSNALVDTGARVLNSLQPSACLTELLLSDAPDPADCSLARMAAQPVLSRFRNVVLLSSPQDGFIPRHSARIERSSDALADRRLGPTIGKMVRLLDEQLARVNAVRLEVVWPEGAGPLTLAKVTGREAHLHFLDSTLFYRLFLQTMGRRYLCE